MHSQSYIDEAEACRRQAAQFAGRPEARFLMRLARSFEELGLASCVGGSANEARSGGGLPPESRDGAGQ